MKKYTETEREADSLLAEIRKHADAIDLLNNAAAAEVEVVAARYGIALANRQATLGGLEKRLVELMKAESAVFFRDLDVVNLLHGSLIHGEKRKITVPKTAVAKAKAAGLTAIIKIVETIDRDKIKKWTDEKLLLIGATAKKKETFEYDLGRPEAGERRTETGEKHNAGIQEEATK